jgi:hypothetical protein
MASEKRHDYPSILPITKKASKKPGTTPKTKKSRKRNSSGIDLTGPTPIASVGAPPKYNNLS